MTSQNKEYSGIELDKEYLASAVVEAYDRTMCLGVKSVEFPSILKIIKFHIEPIADSGTVSTLLIQWSDGSTNSDLIADRTIHIDSNTFNIEWKKMLEMIHTELVLLPSSSHKRLEYAKEFLTT